jgi:hypothetical protein
MRTELNVLNRDISVPGVSFTRTGLEFSSVDEATLARAGGCLQEMANCGDWWWGDYLLAYAEFRLVEDNESTDLAAMDDGDKEKHRRAYVRNHASVVTGRQLADTQLERYKVARFYTVGTRLAELSNEHHRLAMDGAGGDLAVAQEWLGRARDRGWSWNELRAEMRAAKRAGLAVEPEHVTVTQQELFACKRWARAQMPRLPDMQPEEAARMLVDLQPIIELAKALAPIAGKILPVAPGKESLRKAS